MDGRISRTAPAGPDSVHSMRCSTARWALADREHPSTKWWTTADRYDDLVVYDDRNFSIVTGEIDRGNHDHLEPVAYIVGLQ